MFFINANRNRIEIFLKRKVVSVLIYSITSITTDNGKTVDNLRGEVKKNKVCHTNYINEVFLCNKVVVGSFGEEMKIKRFAEQDISIINQP